MNRAERIAKNFSFTKTATGYRVAWLRSDGTVFAEVSGADIERVRSEARAQFGHFNFSDEVEAFREVLKAPRE